MKNGFKTFAFVCNLLSIVISSVTIGMLLERWRNNSEA